MGGEGGGEVAGIRPCVCRFYCSGDYAGVGFVGECVLRFWGVGGSGGERYCRGRRGSQADGTVFFFCIGGFG